MLQSELYECNDAYIAVKEKIIRAGIGAVTGAGNREKKKKFLAFKNNALFISCISKINNVLIGNAEDLRAVLPIYNIIE